MVLQLTTVGCNEWGGGGGMADVWGAAPVPEQPSTGGRVSRYLGGARVSTLNTAARPLLGYCAAHGALLDACSLSLWDLLCVCLRIDMVNVTAQNSR